MRLFGKYGMLNVFALEPEIRLEQLYSSTVCQYWIRWLFFLALWSRLSPVKIAKVFIGDHYFILVFPCSDSPLDVKFRLRHVSIRGRPAPRENKLILQASENVCEGILAKILPPLQYGGLDFGDMFLLATLSMMARIVRLFAKMSTPPSCLTIWSCTTKLF